MADTILILGATGLFGGHLARQLIADGYDVVCAARSEGKLDAFTAAHGGRAQVLGRTDAQAVTDALTTLAPRIVIDAAGPFQAYGDDPYRFARQVIEAGAHYLDLADASAFVAGIGALDDLARAKGVTVLSGASSTPALSSAVVDALAEGLDHVETIETAIMPGNKTDRGLSVIRAILGQTGQPYQQFMGGRWVIVHGWDNTKRVPFAAGGRYLTRLAALNETPEVALFPGRYTARTSIFRAGLELSLMHRGLAAMRWPVRWGLVGSLEPLSKLVLRVSTWMKGLGSDAGGMKVSVLGQRDGAWVRRTWSLVAGDGEGPRIPATPAARAVPRLLAGQIEPGARPACGIVPLDDLEAAMAKFGVVTERGEEQLTPIFARALGDDLARLPAPIRDLHTGLGIRRYEGRADVDGPEGVMARIAAWIAGFAPTGRDVPVEVTIDADETREIWTRNFAGHRFRSILRHKAGRTTEQFGPATFTLGLSVDGEELDYPVGAGRAFGLIPIPRFLVPVSVTRERVDPEGRFVFDVRISLRSGALIGHYRGWLVPISPA